MVRKGLGSGRRRRAGLFRPFRHARRQLCAKGAAFNLMA